jgi:cytochrome c-type biogenesis protein CcmH/NrfG
MPEQPAPPSSPWAVTSASDEMPHWGDEAVDAPLVAAAPINGHHKESHDSVVMRVRTPAMPGGSRPLTRETIKPARPIPRQTEQLATLNAMVEAQPDNHFARLTLAVAYVSARQPEQALTEYRRLIKDSEELLPEVVERLKEMIADGDAPSRTHRVLGDAYMKLGQFDLAMAEFQRALNSRPRVAK